MEWWQTLFGDEDERELLRRQRESDAQATPRVPALQQAIWNLAAPIANLYGGSRRGGGAYPGNISQPYQGESAADMAREDRAGILAGKRDFGGGGLRYYMDQIGESLSGGPGDKRLPAGGGSPHYARQLPIAPGRAILPRLKGMGEDLLSLYPGDPITGPLVGAAGDSLSRGRGQVMRSGGSLPERILAGAFSTFVPPADTVTGGYGKRRAPGGHDTLSQGEMGEQDSLNAALAVQSGEVPDAETYHSLKWGGEMGSEGVRSNVRKGQRLFQAIAEKRLPTVKNPVKQATAPFRRGGAKYNLANFVSTVVGSTPSQRREESNIAYGYAGRLDPRVVRREMGKSRRAYGQAHSGDDPLAYQRLIAKNKAQGRDPYSGFSQEERVAYQQKPISRASGPRGFLEGGASKAAQRRQEMGKQAQALSRSKYGQAYQQGQPTPWGIQQQPQQQPPDRITKMQQNMQRLRQIEELRRRQVLAQSGFSVSPTYY